jgi:hypothetical protein
MSDPLGLFGEGTKQSTNDPLDLDPLGLFANEEPKKKEMSWKQALITHAANAGNITDLGLSTLAGSAAALFGDSKEALKIEENRLNRKKTRDAWAGTEGQDMSFGQKLAGVPAAIFTGGLGAVDTADKLHNSGESLAKTYGGAAIDAAGNVVGMILPGFKQGAFATRATTGFATNAAQDATTKKLIQELADTKQAKEQFQPTWEDAAVAGVAGGVGAAASKRKPKTNTSKLDELRLKQAEINKSKVSEYDSSGQGQLFPDTLKDNTGQASPYNAGQAGVIEPVNFARDRRQMELDLGTRETLPVDKEGNVGTKDLATQLAMEQQRKALESSMDAQARSIINQENIRPNDGLEGQQALFKPQDEFGGQSQFNVIPEKFTTDENGIPIRHDLSLDVQRAQDPLQLGLFDGAAKTTPEGVEIRKTEVGYEAYKNGQLVGKLESNLTGEQSKSLGEKASVDIVKVDPSVKGTGIGSALYDAWNAEHGGAITPSGKTSPDAWALWKKNYPKKVDEFINQEAARILDGSPKEQVLSNITDPVVADKVATIAADVKSFQNIGFMKRQGGGLFLGDKERVKFENSLDRSEDGTYIPNDPKTQEVLTKALAEGRDGKLWTYIQSGATSAAMKTGSAAIKAASEFVQNASKRAELLTRQVIFPVESSLRKLSKEELTTLGTLFKDEMFSKKRYDSQVLMDTLSIKELEAYTSIRNMFDKTLDIQNATRIAEGKKPINANEAYISSRWNGDFRRPIYDTEGKLVWYLAATSRLGLEGQTKTLLKQFPTLVIDKTKDHTVRSLTNKTDLQSTYTTILDLLGRDDPAVQQIKQAIEDQLTIEGSKTLGQEKHFQTKSNVRGFIGDTPGKFNTKESLAMFQEQIQYAKNAFKWAEMQKATEGIKQIVASPELQVQQPNNVKYIREYSKNALGFGESTITKAIEDSIRSGLGISPSLISDTVGNLKSYFIVQKLAVSAGYTLANMVQATNTIPYLFNLQSNGFNGNPAKAVLLGMPSGLAMGTAHYLKSIGGEYLDKLPNQFFKEAFQYAEDNGVTARSVFDESPIETSFSATSKAVNIASKSMSIPETFVRSTAFMTYAHMLEDSGQYGKDRVRLFQHAEELVNKSMVDYRGTEKPLMFSKAGTAGNFLNTLQTYPMSFYNQYAYMSGEAMKGKPAGLVTMLMMQYGIAGLMGMPGFEDIDKLYKWIRDSLLPTDTWNRAMKSEFFSDPKLWLMKNAGDSSVYGALSETTGLGLTSRVAAPGMGSMIQSPIGPIVDIYGQVGAVASALENPTNTTKVAQAAMKIVPTGLQGLLETSGFMKDHTYVERPDGTKTFMKTNDLAKREASYTRTEDDVAIRKFGIRSQNEVQTKDIEYAFSTAKVALSRHTNELSGKIYDAARRGNTEEVSKLMSLYVDLTGKDFDSSTLEREIKQEFMTRIEQATDKTNSARQLLLLTKALDALKGTK